MNKHHSSNRLCLVAVIVLSVLGGFARPVADVRALSRPIVTVTPNVVEAEASYAISFTTERALAADSDVTLQFPAGTILPCTSCNPYVAPQKILINGQNPSRAGFGERYTMTIIVYLDKAVAAGDRIDIVLASTVGIRNPEHPGMYGLSVWTDAEPTPVRSEEYAIGESLLSSVLVRPEVGMASATSGYHVEFITGANGSLSPNTNDMIVMSFSASFVLPVTLKASAVLVNNKVSRSVVVDAVGGKITVGVPAAIGALAAVAVDIAGVPGITNPSSQGSYYVLVHTSRDVGDVPSLPFSILVKPAVSSYSSIVPTAPDGDSGWFITAPLITLEGKSNALGDVELEWALDDGEFQEYVTSVNVPDGVHTFRFRARNDAASLVETETHSIQLKVDTQQPRVEFDPQTSPLIYSANPVLVRGRVIRAMSSLVSLEFGGHSVVPQSDGQFMEQFTLAEGENRLLLVARTESGRIATVEWSAMLDTTAPALSITSVRNWQTVAGNEITVVGTVELGATVSCQGQVVGDIGTDGTWKHVVMLNPGQNIITATAVDAAGNRRIVTVVVLNQGKSHTVVLTVGKATMMVDGVSQAVDPGRTTTPVIIQGRTMVPISAVMSAVGGTAAWDAAARKVTLKLGTHTVALTIGQVTALVDGKTTLIDAENARVVPIITNGRTMLPLRFVGESFGASVSWDAVSRMVTISFPAS